MLYEAPRAETRLAVYRAASVSANLASILAFSLRKCSVSFLPILASMLRKCSIGLEPILLLRCANVSVSLASVVALFFRSASMSVSLQPILASALCDYFCQFVADRGYHVAQMFLSV